ncbi:oligosaccharide flippase family protein [Bradyrhizobium sp. TM102]|uniref:oligosaccharide flippase family protein n=1 Tax=Bradyrhizobium sp. TM102 TaxID=2599819 RepID=UPI001260EF07|nr:oligosaccharide flippase family protein [Bradyrhizobium sp. TM102]BBO14651.1 hypothetical protein TM102_61210 [Bradyrhizobium sp. TM102]
MNRVPRLLQSPRWLGNLMLLTGRASVYASGFLYNLVFSSILSPAQFGEFATLMAMAELLLVPVTLGSGLLVYREARRTGVMPAAQIATSLGIGAVLALLLLLALSSVPRFTSEQLFFALSIALPLGATQLVMNAFRGFGSVTLFTLDPVIRYFLYTASASFLWLCSVHDLREFLLAIVASNCVILVAYFWASLRGRERSWRLDGVDRREQSWLLFSALLSFAVRKSDILLLSSSLGNAELGNFKIALVLSEAPMQFVQAIMYKYSATFEFGYKGSRRRIALSLGALALLLSFAALCAAFVFQNHYSAKYDFLSQMPYLLSYYFFRVLCLPLDQALVMDGRAKLLTVVYGISAILKVSILLASAQMLGSAALVVYPVLGLIDVAIVQAVVRKHVGISFLRWLLG